ncbi:hypothetical protein G9A89_008391 [Geosiphon pyriformis]|nr:hypothetical protein G9A89_008391 [Geosiphon pyriformis]
MHLGSTLLVFASAPTMVPAPQMTATSFATHTQDPNEQLIDKLTANFTQLLEPLAQAPQQPPYQRQQNHGPPVCYCCGLTGHFFRDCNNPLLPSLALRNNDIQNNRPNNNNVPNQRPNYANINFFGEDLLVEATSTSQPEKNLFFAFNLTDDDHDIDKLAINTFDLTRKKKKAKIDFVLDLNKASTSTANNNKPPKAKVFKNPPKLKPPEIVQKSGSYSVVKDLMEMPIHITFGQLITHLQFRKDFHKLLIPKKKTPKTNKHSCQAGLADNSNVTPLICKVQVASYFIELIIDSRSSVSVIAKHFFEAIGRMIDESSTRPMTNIHTIPVRINDISIKTDIEVSEAKEYTIIVGNKWFKKAKALLNYKLWELTIRYSEKFIVNQEKKQSDKLDDNKSNNKENQEDQEKTAKLAYTIFISNSKPLDNAKADKEGIIINGKLICWPYYDILKRTFDKKSSKKAKYSYWWHGPCACLISREELKKVQKFFENKPPEI